MKDAERTEILRAKLGAKTRSSTATVAGKSWTVYRAPSPSAALPPSDAAYYDVMQTGQDEVAADASLRSIGIRHFVGDGGRSIVAVPDLPPLDVVELAKVGTHNGAPDDWRGVQALLRDTIATLPFDVVFADEAGLDVRANDPVDPTRARAWACALLDRVESEDRWVDSLSFMLDSASDLGLEPDPEGDERDGGLLSSFIAATGSLRLWWD
jgi:hypothetical protein